MLMLSDKSHKRSFMQNPSPKAYHTLSFPLTTSCLLLDVLMQLTKHQPKSPHHATLPNTAAGGVMTLQNNYTQE